MDRRLPTLTIACILLPVSAWAQAEPAPEPAPEPPATAAPDAPPPAAQPAPKPAPPPAPPPGTQYYSEPPPAGGGQHRAGPPPQGPPPGPGVYEPPPPGYYQPVWEPPPPPKPRHRAPKTAFWLGPRAGWFIPFGNLWLTREATGVYDEVKWSEYASAGPMFELDIGARFSRHYNVFLLWEHASLGNGSRDGSPFTPTAKQDGAETDYYAIGLRFSSDADKVGFLTEIDLGTRRFRATWDDGSELQLTEAPLEFRIGLGADIRLTKFFSISPLVTLGAGAFGAAELVAPNGDRTDATKSGDEGAGHGWVTFQLGAHFDIPGGDGD